MSWRKKKTRLLLLQSADQWPIRIWIRNHHEQNWSLGKTDVFFFFTRRSFDLLIQSGVHLCHCSVICVSVRHFKHLFLNMSNDNPGTSTIRSSRLSNVWIDPTSLLRYEPFEFNTDKIYISHINTVIFLQSTYQYIWESIIFSRGAPYRRSIFSNCRTPQGSEIERHLTIRFFRRALSNRSRPHIHLQHHSAVLASQVNVRLLSGSSPSVHTCIMLPR